MENNNKDKKIKALFIMCGILLFSLCFMAGREISIVIRYNQCTEKFNECMADCSEFTQTTVGNNENAISNWRIINDSIRTN